MGTPATVENRTERPFRVSPFFANPVVQSVLFVLACAFAGLVTFKVQSAGGLALVAAMSAFIFFAICMMASARMAIFLTFAFCLVQPVVTRLIFNVDFPDQLDQSMLGYQDPLTTTVSLLLIASSLLAIALHFGMRSRLTSGPLAVVILFYIILNIVECINPGTTLVAGIYGAKNNISPILMLFAGSIVVQSAKDTTRFVKFIAWFSIVALLYGLCQQVWGVLGFEKYYFSRTIPYGSSMYLIFVGDLEIRDPYLATNIEIRIPSLFQGYTFFSYIIAAFGIVVYGAGKRFAKGHWKYLRMSVLALLALYFALSMERASIAMFLVGVLGVHFARSIEKKRFLRVFVLSAIVVVAFFGVVGALGQSLVKSGALAGNPKLIRLVELANPFTASTVTFGRFKGHWPEAMAVIKEHPLTGTGTGSAMYTRGVTRNSEIVMPHNQYLQALLELGPLGLLGFLLILLIACRLVIRECKRKDNDPSQRAYASGAIGVLAAYVACAIMNVPFTYTPGTVFWFLAGAALSCGTTEALAAESEENTNLAPVESTQ